MATQTRRLDAIERELKELQEEWEKAKSSQINGDDLSDSDDSEASEPRQSKLDLDAAAQFCSSSLSRDSSRADLTDMGSEEPCQPDFLPEIGNEQGITSLKSLIPKRKKSEQVGRKKRPKQTTAELIHSAPLLTEASDNSRPTPILSLPNELFLHIFTYLEPQELSKVALINQQMKALSEDDTLWKKFCEWRWPKSSSYHRHSYGRLDSGGQCWKHVYLHKSRVDKTWMSPTYRPRVTTLPGHTDDVLKVRFNENLIVSGSQDRTIKIWSMETGKCLRTLTGHRGNVYCVRFDPHKIVSCSQDHTIKIWDIETGKCYQTLRGHTDKVWCVRFDEQKIVSGSFDHTLKLWDINSNRCYQTLAGHSYYVYDLQYDDDKVVSCSAHPDNTIRIWDLAMGKCRKILTGHSHYVYCLQYDDEKIISGSGDQKIKIWDIHTGACTDTLLAHTSPVWGIQFDENKIVSASADHSIKIWDINTKKVVNTLYGHSQSIWTVQFDDEKVVSGSIDRTIKVWNFRGGEDELAVESTRAAKSNLSPYGEDAEESCASPVTPYAGFRQKKYTDPKKKKCNIQ